MTALFWDEFLDEVTTALRQREDFDDESGED